MKRLFAAVLLTIALLPLGTASFARQLQDSTYPVILKFYSIGTGTPGKEPLEKFVATYRKQNKLPKLQATQVSGLGREGEYAILFALKELTTAQRKKFATALLKALPTLKKKGEAGGINMTQNQAFDGGRGRMEPQTITL